MEGRRKRSKQVTPNGIPTADPKTKTPSEERVPSGPLAAPREVSIAATRQGSGKLTRVPRCYKPIVTNGL